MTNTGNTSNYSKRISRQIDPQNLTEIRGSSLSYQDEFYMNWMYGGRPTVIVGPLKVVCLYNNHSGRHIVAVDEHNLEQVIPLATDRFGDYPIFYRSK